MQAPRGDFRMTTLQDIADTVSGTIEGDASIVIEGVESLEHASEGQLSFLANAKYATALAASKASAVIVGDDWEGDSPCALLRVENPDLAFARAAVMVSPPDPVQAPGIHETAVIAAAVTLGDDVCIGPNCILEPGVAIGARTQIRGNCYIGHASRIGEHGLLHAGVCLRERVQIGDRVIIHCGAVIGSDGFGYVQTEGRWTKIPQVGVVEMGHDVEIGANVTIDRARFGKTIIEDGVKIDNLVQVAHNVRLGAHTALAAQVGIAGSTTVGSHVQMGGQAGVTGHVKVGDRTGIAGGAGVTKDIPADSFVSGFPAIPHAKATRLQAHVSRLPKLKESIAALEARIRVLEENAKDE